MARRGRTAIAERQGERPQESVAELEARIAALTAELRLKDERYGLVIQAVAEGIYEWDIERNSFWPSARLIEIFGFHGRDLTAGDWNELVHPEDFPRYRAALRDCFRGKTARLDCEYRVRHGDHIRVEKPQPSHPLPVPEDIPLDVLYEDEFLAAVNKPAM